MSSIFGPRPLPLFKAPRRRARECVYVRRQGKYTLVHLLSAVHSTRPRPRPHVCQTGQQETLRVLDGARPRATGVLFSRSHTSRHHDLAGYRPHRTHTTPSSIIMTTLAALPARCGLGASTSRRSPTIQVCVHPRHARADRAARRPRVIFFMPLPSRPVVSTAFSGA